MLTFLQSINTGLQNYFLLLESVGNKLYKQSMLACNKGPQTFQKFKSPPISRHHTCHMMQVSYSEPKILKLPVTLLPGTFCLVHVN